MLPLNGKAPTTGLTSKGHLDATTSRIQIRKWWADRDWNIGAPIPGNLLVLDVDPRNGGDLAELEERAGAKLPRTLEVVSGRGDGGRHLYYMRPFDRPYRGNIPEGIDLKVNGLMVMPPSLHPDTGKPYRWVRREVAHLPEEVIALMLPRTRKPQQKGAGGAAPLASWIRTLRPGERHDGLFWAASRAYEAELGERGLTLLADAAVDIGMNRREAWRVIESAQKDNA